MADIASRHQQREGFLGVFCNGKHTYYRSSDECLVADRKLWYQGQDKWIAQNLGVKALMHWKISGYPTGTSALEVATTLLSLGIAAVPTKQIHFRELCCVFAFSAKEPPHLKFQTSVGIIQFEKLDCASPGPSKSCHKGQGQGQGEMSRTFHAKHCQYGAFILKCPFHVFGEPRVDVGAEIGTCPARHWHCQGRLPGIEDDSCKYGIQTRQRISRSPACDQRAQKPVRIQCLSQVPGAESSEAIARCTERMAGRIHSASALLKRAIHKMGILAAFLGLFSYNLFLSIHWFVFGWSLCLRCLIWMALRRHSGATCSRRARSKLRSCARHCIKASMFLFLIHNSIAFPFSGFLGDGHFCAACFSHCRDLRAPCWPECGNSIGTHGGIEIAWDTAHPIASAPPICRNSVGLSIPIGGRRTPRLFNDTRGFPGEGPVTFDIFTINVSSCRSNFHSIYVSPFGEVAQSTILCAQETRIHPLKAKRLSRDLERQGWDTTIGAQPPVKKIATPSRGTVWRQPNGGVATFSTPQCSVAPVQIPSDFNIDQHVQALFVSQDQSGMYLVNC